MNKLSISFSDAQIRALNIPSNWDEFNLSSISKSASTKDDDLGSFDDFDLKEAITKNPEHLFVKVFAIRENEMNDNGDFFSSSELKKAVKTFIGVPVFVNHQNDDVEKARGKVVHAWFDEKKGGIYTINMVDKVAYPRLARGIETGVITGTSMGCSVSHSLCNICHNFATTAKDFCSHIKERKKKQFSGDHECRYHENGNLDQCPICGSKKKENKKSKHKDQTIFEYNYGVKFIEDSFVVNPACQDCVVSEVLNAEGLNKKVAELSDAIIKIAASVPQNRQSEICESGMCSLRKVAGTSEIHELNQAMNLMERVARSLMAQKERVSLEYVSDIVKTLADVQKISDELIEMGYAKLPSPSLQDMTVGTNSSASPINKERIGQLSSPMSPQAIQAPFNAGIAGAQNNTMGMAPASSQPQVAAPPSYSPMETSYGDDIGRVVRPGVSVKTSNLKKEFTKISENLINSLQAAYVNSYSIKNQIENMSEHPLNTNSKTIQVDRDNSSVIISTDNDGEIKIAECFDGRVLKVSDIDTFDSDMQDVIRNNSTKAAELILNTMTYTTKKEEIKESMENNENIKTAQTQDTVTENQLNGSDLNSRRRESYTGVTESSEQLGGKSPQDVGISSGGSAQVRSGSPTDTIEFQLASTKNGFLARWDDFPEVVTEGQWTDMSREVFAKLPSDWTSYTQSGQLDSLRKSHSWTEPTSVTESQLRGGSTKKASSDIRDMVKSASEAVVDAITTYGLTGDQLKRVSSFIKSNPHNHIKAAYLSLVNAAPWTIDARQDVNAKNKFFKKASSSTSNPIDSAIGAISDNLGSHRAEDFIDAVNFVINDKSAWKVASDKASERMDSAEGEDSVSSKEDAFKKAFIANELPEDGMFKVCASIKEDIKVDPSDNKKFLKSVLAYAQNSISERFGNLKVVPLNIDVDEESGVVECTVKQASKLDSTELDAWKKVSSYLQDNSETKQSNVSKTASSENKDSRRARILDELDRLEKSAQMLGGQMPTALNPAGMGAGVQVPGTGAPSGAPAIESLTGSGPPMGGPGSDPMGGLDLGGGDSDSEDSENKPKPASAVCVICGTSDVDVAGGKSQCQGPGCGSNFTIKVVPDASLLDKIMDGKVTKDDAGDNPSEPEKGMGGEGPSVPPPGMPPMAATAKLKVSTLNKFAKSIPFGSISPITGNRNTMKMSNNTWKCLDSGQDYIVRVAADTKDPKSVWAQWEWIPEFKNVECSSCERKKAHFVKGLEKAGITEDSFDAMNLKDKAKAIVSMKEDGLLNRTKLAFTDKDSNKVLGLFKAAFSTGNKFPMETCLEKLARRFGNDAVSLSGPCEGKNLADCVCSNLASEKMYSTGLATKVASLWAEKEAGSECIEDFIRDGLSIKQASTSCEQLRNKYISNEELLAEELTRVANHEKDEGVVMLEVSDPFDGPSHEDASEEMSDKGSSHEVSLDNDSMSHDSLVELENSLQEVLRALEPITHSEDEMSDDSAEVEVSCDEGCGEAPVSDEEMSEDPAGDEDKAAAMLKHAPENMSKDIGESDMDKESQNLADSLKRGRIVGVNKINLDISSLAQALNKSAGGKKLQQSNAQDQSDLGNISSGKALSKEKGEGFNMKGPKLPTNSGKTLSTEHGDSFDASTPEIPAGGPVLEGDSVYKAEKGNLMTGGVNGAGSSKAASKHDAARDAFSDNLSKMAKEMKLNISPAQGQSEIGDIRSGKPLSSENGGNFCAEDLNVPSNDGAVLSSESGDGFDVEMPSIPAGEGSMGHESELGLKSEKQDKITGGQLGAGSSSKSMMSSKPKTATAKSSKESGESSKDAAIKLAGKMLENKIIDASQLPNKIAELQRYEVSQIVDIAKAMFRSSSTPPKGLVTASKGVEHPLVIGESSNSRDGYSDLRSKISSLFSLQQRVDQADETESVQIRKAFK